MPAPLVWTEPFRVRAYEVGPGDTASPLAIVDYFQEAAGEHARALGVETFDLGGSVGAWVMTRMAVEFERLPRWRDAVTVETWPSGRDGLRATRDLLLLDADGNRLARARTVWLVVDLARRRPVRLPPAVLAIDPPEREATVALEEPPAAPEQHEAEQIVTVRRSDLDRNDHANNARFVEWALDASDRDLATLRALDVSFIGEARLGDVLTSVVGSEAENTLAHAILREGDRRPLATLRTRWS